MALCDRDRSLLSALYDPDADILTVAASHGMDESDLVDWSAQPHIRRRVRAQRRLRHERRDICQEALASRALHRLDRIAETTADPVESRRASTTILVAIHKTNRPQPLQSSVRKHAERAPALSPSACANRARTNEPRCASAGPAFHPPNQSPAPPRPPTQHSALSTEHSPSPSFRALLEALQAAEREEDSNPLTPATLAKIDAGERCALPARFYANPQDLLDRVADRLSLLPNPTGHRAYLAIYEAIDLHIRKNPETWDPFKTRLESSSLCTAHASDGWTRTAHPIKFSPDHQAASRQLTWTHPDGRTTRCTIHLKPRGPDHVNPAYWWITDIITDDTG